MTKILETVTSASHWFQEKQRLVHLHKTQTESLTLEEKWLLKIFRFSNPSRNLKNKEKRKRESEREREKETQRDQGPKPCRSKNTSLKQFLNLNFAVKVD